MKNNYFKEKVIIITGASSGIGKELAIQLSEKNAKLILAARKLEKLEKVKKICRSNESDILIVKTDVSKKEDCKNLIEKTIEKFGKIDILINNAGITIWAKFAEIKDLLIFEKIININYLGSVYCTYYALPYLKQTKGQIIGISSLTGKNGVPTRTAYAASKHAMAGFFDSLRIELYDEGIDITMIYPGFVKTDIRKNGFGKGGKILGESHIDEKGVMSVEKCGNIIIKAIKKRKREIIMTPKGKIGIFLKPFFPKLIDKIAKKSIAKGKT
jgi:short-subunit dehydrogenase